MTYVDQEIRSNPDRSPKVTAYQLQAMNDALTAHAAAPVAYTPTLSNATLGNGTVSGLYHDMGGLIFCQGDFLLGSTSSITGTLGVSLPVTPLAGVRQRGEASYADASSGLNHIGCIAISNLGVVTFPTSTGTSVNSGANPFTFATGDRIVWSFAYLPA